MKVLYSDRHRRHAPLYQLFSTGLSEASDVPERAERILEVVRGLRGVEVAVPREQGSGPIRAVHDEGYLHFLEQAYRSWETPDRETDFGIVPDTFAMRTLPGKPNTVWRQAGYYCFETQTPIVEGTFRAALSAAWCALTGAECLMEGEPAAYALCRPPGHHAARDVYGGYCYLNNAAIAAQLLAGSGRVAILDVDYHHGNGTQAIFYDSDAVLFVSIHADPDHTYPFFSGYEDEGGAGNGRGKNRNFPLEAGIDGQAYLASLERALEVVVQHRPEFLVVSLGVDIYCEDPLGKFEVSLETFTEIGRQIRGANLPTLFVQEGGYNLEAIGECVMNVLAGFEDNDSFQRS